MARLDPADLRRYANRTWSPTMRLDRKTRAERNIAEKVATAIMLYEAARKTRPDWPSTADRLADLEHHRRMTALLRRAAHVGAR